MIKFNEVGKRKYQLLNWDKDIEVDTPEPSDVVVDLDLMFSPITNKFFRLTEFVEGCSAKLGKDFDDWFVKMINDYKNSNYDYLVIRRNIPELKAHCDKYLELREINFEDYINRSKASKNSIFFDAEEIKKIIQASSYLKIYFAIGQDQKMKLSNKFHKETYNKLIEDINDNSIIYKLFKIVSSKTYEYNYTDKYMWDYIKTIYCKTTDMHVFSIFNFIMNNILVTCKIDSNPIPYLISVIDESIKWILKNIYKDAIIYSETISTQDVYTIQGKDNLSSYAHNDTIGKLLIISYNHLENIGVEKIEPFKNTINSLKEISLFANYITYPLLSKVLDIPYRHFLTLSVSNAYLLNLLVHYLLPEEFKTKFPILSRMLLYYNKQKPILKTTYKVKNIDVFTETLGTFLSFKNNITPYDFYSSIIGKLSRNTYSSFINDQEIVNFPLAKLEVDIIKFYNDYFDNRLDPLFDELRTKVDVLL
jgi:hypothetical protein